MSSAPFCLGVPVVDDIPAESGTYVLRTRSYHDLALKVNDLQNRLSKRDLIKLYFIGYRPDKPIPVGRLFTEVAVDIGGAQKRQSIYGLWCASAYHRIATGMKDWQVGRTGQANDTNRCRCLCFKMKSRRK